MIGEAWVGLIVGGSSTRNPRRLKNPMWGVGAGDSADHRVPNIRITARGDGSWPTTESSPGLLKRGGLFVSNCPTECTIERLTLDLQMTNTRTAGVGED
ncbi:hypothetical protein R1flu_011697 [Riccia fluitans]|uniref:Uncharacterized protein n=1 Tax=Riccia fluitans TaxID=41844 RepID=A0ABD1Z8Q8_9MARC